MNTITKDELVALIEMAATAINKEAPAYLEFTSVTVAFDGRFHIYKGKKEIASIHNDEMANILVVEGEDILIPDLGGLKLLFKDITPLALRIASLRSRTLQAA